MRQVRERILEVQLATEAQVRTHQPTATHVSDLHEALQTQTPPDRTQEIAYRREALPVHGGYMKIFKFGSFQLQSFGRVVI